MLQQINLYKDYPKPVAVKANLTQVSILFGVIFLGLLSMTLFDSVQLHYADKQLKTAQLRQKQSAKKLLSLVETNKQASEDPELEQEVVQLAKNIKAKAHIISLISAKEEHNSKGFSAYLLALARAVPNGLWLTHIELRDGGASIALQGKCLNSATVPEFINRLQQQEVFANKHFQLMRIEQPKQQAEQDGPVFVAFSLQTSPDAEEQAA